MSILKTLFIFALVLAVASARSRQRQRGRSSHRQRGRQMEEVVADAAALPEAEENNAVIEDALAAATEQKEILEDPSALSAPEAADASATLQENLNEAIAVAAEQPQAQEVQPEIVAEKVEESHYDLEQALKMAKRHQKALKKYGATMTPDEAIEHHKALQKYLELALHNAEQHSIAVQEEKAIEVGVPPEEVAEIAPAVIAGRFVTGRAAAKAAAKACPACGGGIGR